MAKKNRTYGGMNFKRKAIAYCKEHDLGVPAYLWKNKRLFDLIEAHKAGNTVEVDRLKSLNAAGNVPKSNGCATARLARIAFYESDAWKRLRYQALKIHGAICQCCGATRADGVKIHVDHIKPRSKYPHLELELNNLQILCEPCNIGKSAIDETDWRDQPKTRGTVIWADSWDDYL